MALRRMVTFIKAIFNAYKNALVSPGKPFDRRYTREEIQELERQKALQYLEETKKRRGGDA